MSEYTNLGILKKLDEAIAWNGALFTFSKINKTILSCLLFSKLPLSDFSAWATNYSLIFLLLLWSDFGFSKSLPQYIMYASHAISIRNRFLYKVVFLKIILLVLSLIFFYFSIPTFLVFFKLEKYKSLFLLSLFIFSLEGVTSLLKLIFHSFFWNKYYNILESSAVTFHLITVIILTTLNLPTTTFLHGAYIAHGISLIFLIALATKLLSTFMKHPYSANFPYSNYDKRSERELFSEFITHSASMWSLLVAQSITERNFLVPFFLVAFNPTSASVFKIANDIAMVFQRFSLKTLGTSPTSLLTFFNAQGTPNIGLELITRKILRSIIPPAFILLAISATLFSLATLEVSIAKTAALLTLFYLTQVLCIGYDHILEVGRNYTQLFKSALPYGFICIFYLFLHRIHPTIIQALIVIYSLKTISIFLRVYYAKQCMEKISRHHSLLKSQTPC